MNYFKTVNLKTNLSFYIEVNDRFIELRKIEISNGDLLGFAGSDIEFHGTTLFKQPLLNLSELNGLPDIEAQEIHKDEFEDLWKQVMDIALAS